MKKITIMGIVAGVVLAVGIFSNIGLFGSNALAAEPSTEQKIKTMFWMITNKEYGLKKIMNSMYVLKNDMKNDMQAMNDDLQQKKSFYEVEDTVLLYEGNGSGPVTINAAVTVSLGNCDEAIPLEKRAFNIETLGVRMGNADGSTVIVFEDVIVDKNYRVFGGIDKTLAGEDKHFAFIDQIGASDQIQYVYQAVLFDEDALEGLPFKAVAVGQMPQGCEITVDADAEQEGLEEFIPPD